MTDISDLIAQQQTIAVQLAALIKPKVEAARDALIASQVETLRTNLSDIANLLPAGVAKEQIGNVVTVLSVVPGILDGEIASLDAQIAAAEAGEEPEAPPAE